MKYNAAETINERLTMADIIEHYSVGTLKKNKMCCPLHGEKTPSFTVKGIFWHCFGCGEGGDIIGFVMRYFELDYKKAVSKLDYDFTLGLSKDKPTLAELHAIRREQKERERIKAETARKKVYSRKAYIMLCRYNRYLHSLPETEAVKNDIEYLDRLLPKYYSEENLIEFDVEALISALMSKHDKGGTVRLEDY